MKEIKTAALIGVGSIGSFLAPRLLEALGPQGFRIVLDGARRERAERDGFLINGKRYDFPIVSSHEALAPADLILIGVKATALDEALEQIANQVGPDTIIMSLLNGVDSEEQVIRRFPTAHVLYSFMLITVGMRNYQVDYDPRAGLVMFGEQRNQTLSEQVQAVQALFEQADIPHRIPADMLHALWFKFLTNVSENLTCALLGITYGAFQSSAHAEALRELALREVAAVAAARGIHFTAAELDRQKRQIAGYGPERRPSTLQDLDAKRKTEIELFAGKMLELGQKHGVPTPVCAVYYHAIKVLEEKNAGLFQY